MSESLARLYLSDGAVRALLRHTREDGGLYESVLGADDAEELWFCSMKYLVDHGERIVTRAAQSSGITGNVTWLYTLTELGRAVRSEIAG